MTLLSHLIELFPFVEIGYSIFWQIPVENERETSLYKTAVSSGAHFLRASDLVEAIKNMLRLRRMIRCLKTISGIDESTSGILGGCLSCGPG